MKKLIVGGLATLAIAAGIGAPIAPANATPYVDAWRIENDYVNRLYQEGFTNTLGVHGLVTQGYAICDMKQRGWADDDLVDYYQSQNHALSRDLASKFVMITEVWLCEEIGIDIWRNERARGEHV